jgi:hypothetical protein
MRTVVVEARNLLKLDPSDPTHLPSCSQHRTPIIGMVTVGDRSLQACRSDPPRE